MKRDAKSLPPVPVRRGYVIALVVVVVLVSFPFVMALVLDRSEDVTIEPLARLGGVVAILGAPVIAIMLGLRRGLAPRLAFMQGAGIMAIACFAILVGVTSTRGAVQSQVAYAIAAVALTVAFRVRPSAPRDAPARPDLERSDPWAGTIR